jgi:hypothetical protein
MQIKLNCGGRAWPSQAKGAVQPRGSSRTFSRGQILSADIVIANWTAHEPSRRFRTLTVSDLSRSSPEIQPPFNTHRSRSG